MMPELAFVTFDPSTKIQSATVRRTVRSQAAKSGQPQRRAPRVKRQARFQAVEADKHVRAVVVASPAKAWDLSPPATARRVSESGLLTPLTGKSSTMGSRSTSENDSGSEKSFTLMSEPTHPVLMMQPLLARPYSPLLNHYYLSCMAINIPDLDLDTPGILRVLWFPYVLMNDGILSVILLLAGASFANSRYISEQQMADIRSSLIELKAHSLLSIRRMICDPNTNSSDVAIATVLKMASYESTFGSTDAYHLHMTALRQMVQGRGGVGSLGLEGLLARMILWVDYNAACLINTRMHFLEESSGLPKPMEFGPETFVGYE